MIDYVPRKEVQRKYNDLALAISELRDLEEEMLTLERRLAKLEAATDNSEQSRQSP